MNQIIEAGIIGYGLAGRVFHAPLLSEIPGFKVSKILTTDPDRITSVKKKYPGTGIAENFQEILNDEQLSLVIIASPNEFHFEQTKQALFHNKHVVCDKPFTISSAEADELIAIANERHLILSAFQNRRWDSDFQTIQKLLAEKRLGEIVEAEIHFDRFRKFIKPNSWKEESRPGGGILYDLGAHLVDQAQVLFGLPEAVTGLLTTQRIEGRNTDNFEIILHYPKLKVTLKAGMLVRTPLPRYIITGQNASFIKHGLDVQEDQLDNGMSTEDDNFGVEPNSLWGTLYFDQGDKIKTEIIESEKGNYKAYYQNVYNAITKGVKLAVPAIEGRNNIRIIELAILSSSEKRTISFY